MGYQYLLVHVKYTIPPALFLTLVARPFLTALDVYKIVFLVIIAIASTIPWDSYLIRNKIWTYPSSVIVGPTLFEIPVEELFFFFIQTYNTSLFYILLSKPVFFPVYLQSESHKQDERLRRQVSLLAKKTFGQIALVGFFSVGCAMISKGDHGTYLGLIVAWAAPFLLLLWSLGYHFILGLPIFITAAPILLNTLYLWIIDTTALNRGTWVIESATKLNMTVWPGLDVEEAVFFLLTNTMIVFGLITFDNAQTILETFPSILSRTENLPSPWLLIKALFTPTSFYDERRITGLQAASEVLNNHSRSFRLASCVFPERLRIDLTILYAICRIADDLIDGAASPSEAEQWISRLKHYLELSYSNDPSAKNNLQEYVSSTFPPSVQSILLLLPTKSLSSPPFYELLHGFEIDSQFSTSKKKWPIRTDAELDIYAQCVAGSVGELCLHLVFAYCKSQISTQDRRRLIEAGRKMGTALQLINIARDIQTDAIMGRVYIPTSWLKEAQLRPIDVIEDPSQICIKELRRKLLLEGFARYHESRDAIEELPSEAKRPIRAAVESYMEIGRVLLESDTEVQPGKATVPILRRIKVFVRSLIFN